MYKLNRFQTVILKLIRINPNSIVAKAFNVEQALWDRYHSGKEEGLAQGRREASNCQHCSLYQQATKGVQILFDPRVRQAPYPQADPSMDYYQHHPGALSRHHKQMERQKITRQLEPKTELLREVKPPLRKLHLWHDTSWMV